MFNRNRSVMMCTAIFSVLTCAAYAQCGGSEVLPACASPYGYSLAEIARATAVYNTGIQAGSPLTPPPPDVPFQVLVGDATVRPDTIFYVPIYVVDDSGGAPAGFPTDINNQRADAACLEGVVFGLYGVTDLIVQVDGKTTVLNNGYIAGVRTPPLLDGTPAGTHYIVSAVFLTPLAPGKHTVGIGGIIGGAPVVFVSYNVTVR